jgi:hypothetical protein
MEMDCGTLVTELQDEILALASYSDAERFVKSFDPDYFLTNKLYFTILVFKIIHNICIRE